MEEQEIQIDDSFYDQVSQIPSSPPSIPSVQEPSNEGGSHEHIEITSSDADSMMSENDDCIHVKESQQDSLRSHVDETPYPDTVLETPSAVKFQSCAILSQSSKRHDGTSGPSSVRLQSDQTSQNAEEDLVVGFQFARAPRSDQSSYMRPLPGKTNSSTVTNNIQDQNKAANEAEASVHADINVSNLRPSDTGMQQFRVAMQPVMRTRLSEGTQSEICIPSSKLPIDPQAKLPPGTAVPTTGNVRQSVTGLTEMRGPTLHNRLINSIAVLPRVYSTKLMDQHEQISDSRHLTEGTDNAQNPRKTVKQKFSGLHKSFPNLDNEENPMEALLTAENSSKHNSTVNPPRIISANSTHDLLVAHKSGATQQSHNSELTEKSPLTLPIPGEINIPKDVSTSRNKSGKPEFRLLSTRSFRATEQRPFPRNKADASPTRLESKNSYQNMNSDVASSDGNAENCSPTISGTIGYMHARGVNSGGQQAQALPLSNQLLASSARYRPSLGTSTLSSTQSARSSNNYPRGPSSEFGQTTHTSALNSSRGVRKPSSLELLQMALFMSGTEKEDHAHAVETMNSQNTKIEALNFENNRLRAQVLELAEGKKAEEKKVLSLSDQIRSCRIHSDKLISTQKELNERAETLRLKNSAVVQELKASLQTQGDRNELKVLEVRKELSDHYKETLRDARIQISGLEKVLEVRNTELNDMVLQLQRQSFDTSELQKHFAGIPELKAELKDALGDHRNSITTQLVEQDSHIKIMLQTENENQKRMMECLSILNIMKEGESKSSAIMQGLSAWMKDVARGFENRAQISEESDDCLRKTSEIILEEIKKEFGRFHTIQDSQQKLNDTISKLREDNSRLEKKLQSQTKKEVDEVARNQVRDQEIEDAHDQIKSLSNELEKARRESMQTADLMTHIQDLKDHKFDLENKLGAATAELETSRAGSVDLKSRLCQLEEELSRARSQIQDLENRRTDAESNMLEDFRQERIKIEKYWTGKVKDDRGLLEGQLETLREVKTELETALKQTQSELKEMLNMKTSLEHQNADLSGQEEELLISIDEFKGRILSLEEGQRVGKENIQDLQSELAHLCECNVSLRLELKQRAQHKSALHADNSVPGVLPTYMEKQDFADNASQYFSTPSPHIDSHVQSERFVVDDQACIIPELLLEEYQVNKNTLDEISRSPTNKSTQSGALCSVHAQHDVPTSDTPARGKVAKRMSSMMKGFPPGNSQSIQTLESSASASYITSSTCEVMVAGFIQGQSQPQKHTPINDSTSSPLTDIENVIKDMDTLQKSQLDRALSQQREIKDSQPGFSEKKNKKRPISIEEESARRRNIMPRKSSMKVAANSVRSELSNQPKKEGLSNLGSPGYKSTNEVFLRKKIGKQTRNNGQYRQVVAGNPPSRTGSSEQDNQPTSYQKQPSTPRRGPPYDSHGISSPLMMIPNRALTKRKLSQDAENLGPSAERPAKLQRPTIGPRRV